MTIELGKFKRADAEALHATLKPLLVELMKKWIPISRNVLGVARRATFAREICAVTAHLRVVENTLLVFGSDTYE